MYAQHQATLALDKAVLLRHLVLLGLFQLQEFNVFHNTESIVLNFFFLRMHFTNNYLVPERWHLNKKILTGIHVITETLNALLSMAGDLLSRKTTFHFHLEAT